MHTLTLEEIINAIGGRLLGTPPRGAVSSICTDSREFAHASHDSQTRDLQSRDLESREFQSRALQSRDRKGAVRPQNTTPDRGVLFFALKGPRHDGHAFVAATLDAGAMAAVVSDAAAVPEPHRMSGRVIVVPDTTAALGQLGRYYRRQIAATVVAVTGSNGKTTTKSMVHAVLSSQRRGRMAPKSFNNSVGVPLTLLSAELSDEFLVVEIGSNAPGEVAALSRIVQPDIAVITSLGEEHLEGFGDLNRIAEEETSVAAEVRPGGLVAVHSDLAERAASAMDRRLNRVTFGTSPSADLRAGDIAVTTDGLRFRVNERFEYKLPALGAHNAVNALGAIAVGRRFAMEHDDIALALLAFRPPPMRLEVQAQGGLTLINDAYNANPTSMQAALAALDAWPGPGRKVALLGDMHELGPHAERCHVDVGKAAGRSSAQVIIAVGRHAQALADGASATAGADKRVAWFANHDAARAALPDLLRAGDIVLLKGSRASAMERLIEHLSPHAGSAGQPGVVKVSSAPSRSRVPEDRKKRARPKPSRKHRGRTRTTKG